MADLSIRITIPDARRDEFVEAYCQRFGWVDLATSGPRAAFVRSQATRLVRAPYRQWRQDQREAAALAAFAPIDDEGITSA